MTAARRDPRVAGAGGASAACAPSCGREAGAVEEGGTINCAPVARK